MTYMYILPKGGALSTPKGRALSTPISLYNDILQRRLLLQTIISCQAVDCVYYIINLSTLCFQNLFEFTYETQPFHY